MKMILNQNDLKCQIKMIYTNPFDFIRMIAMEEKQEIHHRLRKARISGHYPNAATFARQHGHDDYVYRSHENGQRGVKNDLLATYAEQLEVNLVWLMTGEGPMRDGDSPQQTEQQHLEKELPA